MHQRLAALAFACAFAWGCQTSSTTIGGDAGDTGSGTDTHGGDTAGDTGDPGTDPALDTSPDPAVDVPDAVDSTDPGTDPGPDGPTCTEAPPCPSGPPDGVIGRACLGDGACDEVESGRCFGEMASLFDGETYVTYPGGTCVAYTAGSMACDPVTHEGCPEGSRCIPSGEYAGLEYYVCMDACSPADDSLEPWDWACGCRMGYYCDLTYEVCLSGCSNDRECCESWADLDADYERDPGEVTLHSACSNWCDGDDPDETGDCMATYRCVNEGTASARFGDACDHDYQCPPDGECWNWVDWETGEDYYPGGYCSKSGCQFDGRGCEAHGGACLNFGGYDLQGYCLRPCQTGTEVGDPGFACRETAGEEHACWPVDDMLWVGGPPAGGEDGYCFPGSWGSGGGDLGDPCTDVGDCASPLGIGECADWLALPVCTVHCNQRLAEEEAICGEAGAGGVATGICGWGRCWSACDVPGGDLGANGCDHDELACAPISRFGGYTWVADGASRPSGYCMPRCATDGDCTELFGSGSTCDEVSGVCS